MNVEPNYVQWAELKKQFEGFKTDAYADTGNVWTVGYGSTYNHDAKRRVQKGDKINESTAIRWMAIDSESVVKQANVYIKVRQTASQSTAICDYIYNRGIGNFLKTQLDELINSSASVDLICNEILNTGLKDRLGNLLWGLGRRRRAQAYLYKTGKLKFDFQRWGSI